MRNLQLHHLFLLIVASILVAALVSAFIGKNLFAFLPIVIVIAAAASLRRN